MQSPSFVQYKRNRYPYKAPECLLHKPSTKASDSYSFRMIMHAVGTGNIPQYITKNIQLH